MIGMKIQVKTKSGDIHTTTVSAFLKRVLWYEGGGILESTRANADNTQIVLSHLCSLLGDKGILSAIEIADIAGEVDYSFFGSEAKFLEDPNA